MERLPDKFFQDKDFASAFSFFHHVKIRFAQQPAVYEDLLLTLRRFRTGETTDRREVVTKAYALLQGHPDLVRRLDAFMPDEHAPEPAREYPAPRRPKRQRRPTPAATATVDQGDRISRAVRYLERVSQRQADLYDRLLELISEASFEEATDLNRIYQRARQVFGPANGDLLREFTEYLPIPTGRERVLLLSRLAQEEEENCAPAPQRKAAADNPSAAKRSRADDRRTTNRRANSPAVVDAAAPKSSGVSAFREAWEFETTYTKLVATARRTKELLNAYEPTEDAPQPPPSGGRAFEELFPSRECQEVLREMYHSMLGSIREALEDGARTELALRTIQRRLGILEHVAVKMAMERRDRARVESRMQKLAVDRVLVLRKNQAKQSVGTWPVGANPRSSNHGGQMYSNHPAFCTSVRRFSSVTWCP
uniref:Uncharacterized protein n=1 Tax=Avena sativa TaxID=4498 RepID=A0ACD5TAT3_AVESA